jgi:TonB family protein
MTPLALAISRALIHFVWQGAIAGLFFWMTLHGLRHRSANVRYVVSCAAMIVLALLPLITAAVLYSRPAISQPGVATANIEQAVPQAVPAMISQRALWFSALQSWALPIWSVGVIAFSIRLIFGYRHAFILRRRGRPANDSVVAVVMRLAKLMGVHRPMRVLISSMTDSPSVVGWLRPVILLPTATLIGLTPLQLESILAHEIAHVRRYDYLVNMLQMVVETLLFYHPAVWWTSKRIRLERELCCDDLAVRFSGNALRYARALTRLEKMRLTAPQVAMASTGGPLLYRIQRIVGINTKEYGPSRMPVVVAIGLAVLCFSLNVSWVKGQDAPGVKVDVGPAAVIHRSPVQYPEAAQKKGVTGTVQLEVKLDATGSVADAHVLSGPEELRKSALESVLNWHFTREAANGTRLINISFSDAGKQVQVGEPHIFEGRVYTSVSTDNGKTVVLESNAWRVQAEQAKIESGELTRRQQLEREMGALRREIEQAAATAPNDVQQMKARLEDLRKEFEQTPLPNFSVNRTIVGRTVSGINTSALSDQVSADLIARLPVREGDTISTKLMEETMAAIRSYDEHLRSEFVRKGEDKVELLIWTPESRR